MAAAMPLAVLTGLHLTASTCPDTCPGHSHISQIGPQSSCGSSSLMKSSISLVEDTGLGGWYPMPTGWVVHDLAAGPPTTSRRLCFGDPALLGRRGRARRGPLFEWIPQLAREDNVEIAWRQPRPHLVQLAEGQLPELTLEGPREVAYPDRLAERSPSAASPLSPEFGLRRERGKGGHEAAVPLPEVARAIVSDYLTKERVNVGSSDPMFVVRYRTRSGVRRESRMTGQRVWKLIKVLGRRAGLPEPHPHAFRHGCGAELHRRSGGNLRVVQEHLRHSDIQTTTAYTRLMQHELQRAVNVFDEKGSQTGILIPTRRLNVEHPGTEIRLWLAPLSVLNPASSHQPGPFLRSLGSSRESEREFPGKMGIELRPAL